jgi:hypothetical protein
MESCIYQKLADRIAQLGCEMARDSEENDRIAQLAARCLGTGTRTILNLIRAETNARM